MNSQWLRTEHDRLHAVEEWPDSAYKEAALIAIRSKLASLMRSLGPDGSGLDCEVCLSRQGRSALTAIPPKRRVPENPSAGLAA